MLLALVNLAGTADKALKLKVIIPELRVDIFIVYFHNPYSLLLNELYYISSSSPVPPSSPTGISFNASDSPWRGCDVLGVFLNL